MNEPRKNLMAVSEAKIYEIVSRHTKCPQGLRSVHTGVLTALMPIPVQILVIPP